jgi:NAD(P)-dependent dehydrogenase (short-subunit alcohol dehydrogenase family)
MPRRVALLTDAESYVGPALARVLASRGHDLVLGSAAPGLADELGSLGAAVEVAGTFDDETLVEAARRRFDRLDAAVTFSGRIVTGRFLRSTVEDLQAVLAGCVEAPYRFLRAVVPPMVEQGDGQVLVITSAAAARPTPGAPLYSAARAGAVMLVKNVAAEVAGHGVQVNSVGTNFMDFPGFLKANRAEDPDGRARVEAQVPMKRLGTMEEFANFCSVFLDGTSRFTTGQFVPYAGGWA